MQLSFINGQPLEIQAADVSAMYRRFGATGWTVLHLKNGAQYCVKETPERIRELMKTDN